MNNKDTIRELNDLNSPLANITLENIYSVPEGYFEGLASQILNRIRALNVTDAGEELSYLSPFLGSISKKLPYSVPGGYFDELAEQLTASVQFREGYQTADEELFALSPVLSGIGKQNPYSVPQGYFDGLESNIKLNNRARASAKVVSMVNRKWIRIAAAAVIIGFITLTGIQFLNNNSRSSSHPYGAIDSNGVSTADINSFIQIVDEGSGQNSMAISVKTDIKDLMKDVSDKDIQDFLKISAGSEETDADNVLN
jgi:hypothetical protein